jgi:hypothetical protein
MSRCAGRVLLPDETSRLLPVDRGALTVELDDEERWARRVGRYRNAQINSSADRPYLGPRTARELARPCTLQALWPAGWRIGSVAEPEWTSVRDAPLVRDGEDVDGVSLERRPSVGATTRRSSHSPA